MAYCYENVCQPFALSRYLSAEDGISYAYYFAGLHKWSKSSGRTWS